MFVIGGLVMCCDCDYKIYCNNPYITGKRHNEKTGHEVHIEVYYGEIFNRIPKQIKQEQTK